MTCLNYVSEKLQNILQAKIELSDGQFDMICKEVGKESVIMVHDQIGIGDNRCLNKQQENILLKKWHTLNGEKNSEKFLVFTDPMMFYAFKRLRNNTEEIDESVKLALINYPVYDNSERQICENCSDETLTNSSIHALLRHGFINYEDLDPDIQERFTSFLIGRNLLTERNEIA